ncbi:MAG: metallophosphoesterase [Planctomycetia bacterium]|nr:metallophosphoesterase [Planctomycetia bacterium]
MKARFPRTIVPAILSAAIIALSSAAGAQSRIDLLKGAKAEGEAPVKIVFEVKDPGKFAALEYRGHAGVRLNGKALQGPLSGMNYRTIPALSPALLKKGKNTLTVPGGRPALVGLLPEALAFQSGPVLGAAGTDYFTVACRTNMSAEVTLTVVPAKSDLLARRRKIVSRAAVYHAFRVEKLRAGRPYGYTLEAAVGGKKVRVKTKLFTVRTPAARGELVFVAAGDNRNNPSAWGAVASAVAKVRPAFFLHSGDMVGAGRNDWEWDPQFFRPAAQLLATVPTFAAIGNHEQNAPIFLRMLPSPNGKKNWAQQIGSVLLIGIDTADKWQAGGTLAKWLEETLAKSKAKFIFLIGHHPPWTSGPHGALNAQGRPNERPIRLGQDVIMPLLKKYGATAMLSGHDHFYERSEPRDGVTVIITGGGGAPLYNKSSNAAKQNPYGKVFAKKHHLCIFSIKGNTCTMKVLTLAGEVIDKRTWKARQGR